MENEHRAIPYRIVIHNRDVNDETVRNIVRCELGKVEVIEWEVEKEIHYQKSIQPFFENYPMRDVVVRLYYEESWGMK